MANSNGGQKFRASLKKWAAKVRVNLDALVRQSCFQISYNVVVATPVDTGFLRGSWQPSIGQPGNGTGIKDPAGAAKISEITLTVNGLKAGDRFFMLNNAAYVRRLEYGFVGQDSLGRNYDQAGRFFVTDNGKRWPRVVVKVAKELQ